MKTIQAVARYFPEPCGGIHIHLSEIIPILQAYGVESTVAASQDVAQEAFYDYRGAKVYRYPTFPTPKSEPNHGAVPHGGFDQFARWLKAQSAEIYHQHQWTPQCGLPHLRLAKELGMGTVVSVRLPQPICQRQTLMLNGKEACNGKIDTVRCSYCCGVSEQLPPEVIRTLSHMPMPASIIARGLLRRLDKTPAAMKQSGETILRPMAIPAFVAARRHGLMEMAKYADRIVAMSEWVYNALMINGIPQEKLFLLRHGISETVRRSPLTQAQDQIQGQPNVLRIGFLGRWAPDKGIHILVEAIQSLPSNFPIQLVIHGVPQDEEYRAQIIERVGNDPRIQIAQHVPREELPLVLSNFDVLAVPSQWLETGPVVVLEAYAHGLPVVGSNLGGVAEKVRHGVDGLLVPPQDVEAWAEAFARLVLEANFLEQLRQGIQPVRTIHMEAEESIELYQSVLRERQTPTVIPSASQLQFQPQ